jgi:hypothetical protein
VALPVVEAMVGQSQLAAVVGQSRLAAAVVPREDRARAARAEARVATPSRESAPPPYPSLARFAAVNSSVLTSIAQVTDRPPHAAPHRHSLWRRCRA